MMTAENGGSVAAGAFTTITLRTWSPMKAAVLWVDVRATDGVPAHASIVQLAWNGDFLIQILGDGGVPVSLAHLIGTLTDHRGKTEILPLHDLRVTIRNDSNETVKVSAGLRDRGDDDAERAARFRAVTAHAIKMLEEAVGWAT